MGLLFVAAPDAVVQKVGVVVIVVDTAVTELAVPRVFDRDCAAHVADPLPFDHIFARAQPEHRLLTLACLRAGSSRTFSLDRKPCKLEEKASRVRTNRRPKRKPESKVRK